jgi:hypothetical protein
VLARGRSRRKLEQRDRVGDDQQRRGIDDHHVRVVRERCQQILEALGRQQLSWIRRVMSARQHEELAARSWRRHVHQNLRSVRTTREQVAQTRRGRQPEAARDLRVAQVGVHQHDALVVTSECLRELHRDGRLPVARTRADDGDRTQLTVDVEIRQVRSQEVNSLLVAGSRVVRRECGSRYLGE